MSKNYAKMTKSLTGMSDAQYKREYTKFAARVRNYNAIAGTNYSPAREFYYSQRYAGVPSAALSAIMATPATRARKAGQGVALTGKAKQAAIQRATQVFEKTWAGWWREAENQATFGANSPSLKIRDDLRNGLITYAQADAAMRNLAKIRHTRTDRDPSFRY